MILSMLFHLKFHSVFSELYIIVCIIRYKPYMYDKYRMDTRFGVLYGFTPAETMRGTL